MRANTMPMFKKQLRAIGLLGLVLLGAPGVGVAGEKRSGPTNDDYLTGTGTPGRLPLWGDTTVLGDSVVTQSNGNIGIGTTNPQSLLHLNYQDSYGSIRVAT